jgi:hypothetical protein
MTTPTIPETPPNSNVAVATSVATELVSQIQKSAAQYMIDITDILHIDTIQTFLKQWDIANTLIRWWTVSIRLKDIPEFNFAWCTNMFTTYDAKIGNASIETMEQILQQHFNIPPLGVFISYENLSEVHSPFQKIEAMKLNFSLNNSSPVVAIIKNDGSWGISQVPGNGWI